MQNWPWNNCINGWGVEKRSYQLWIVPIKPRSYITFSFPDSVKGTTFITQTSLFLRDAANPPRLALISITFLKEFFCISDFMCFQYWVTLECQISCKQYFNVKKIAVRKMGMFILQNHAVTHIVFRKIVWTDPKLFKARWWCSEPLRPGKQFTAFNLVNSWLGKRTCQIRMSMC